MQVDIVVQTLTGPVHRQSGAPFRIGSNGTASVLRADNVCNVDDAFFALVRHLVVGWSLSFALFPINCTESVLFILKEMALQTHVQLLRCESPLEQKVLFLIGARDGFVFDSSWTLLKHGENVILEDLILQKANTTFDQTVSRGA